VGRDVVVVGVSAGGLDAMCRILAALPPEFGFALLLVQHRSRDSDALCEVLQACGGHQVREAVDKDAVEPGVVYLAPADYHLLIDDGHIALSLDAPEYFSRPSIDLAFESVADAYGKRAVGLVLTGANADGARGLRRILDRGGLALVQDPATAEVPVMPLAAIQAAPEAEVLALDAIAVRLCALAPLAAPEEAEP
jgi:two-component system, chemotaxis family, protein-glutamate methylesterase/glutaminase